MARPGDTFRTITHRLSRLEQRSRVQIGPWIISADPHTGALYATHRASGVRTLIAVPPAGHPDRAGMTVQSDEKQGA